MNFVYTMGPDTEFIMEKVATASLYFWLEAIREVKNAILKKHSNIGSISKGRLTISRTTCRELVLSERVRGRSTSDMMGLL